MSPPWGGFLFCAGPTPAKTKARAERALEARPPRHRRAERSEAHQRPTPEVINRDRRERMSRAKRGDIVARVEEPMRLRRLSYGVRRGDVMVLDAIIGPTPSTFGAIGTVIL